MILGNIEILQIIEAVAREKGLSRECIITAIEQAIQAAAKKKYSSDDNIYAKLNRNTGEFNLFRLMKVVDKIENPSSEMSISEALRHNVNVKLGDEVKELLPPIDLERISAQIARQVMFQNINEAERAKEYNDFHNREGDIVSGLVKRIENGDIIVDLISAEGVIKRNQLIRGESFRLNERIKAYVQEVKRTNSGPQIFLSRTDDRMLAKLLEAEVPDIYDKRVAIKAIAREPGSKAKVAVFAIDSSVDPIGSCVGVRGAKVKAITTELNGEKIDIILWDRDYVQFIINSMTPAKILKVFIDEDKNKVEVAVASEQLSLAVGARGQNVRLASKLTGWQIEVISVDQEAKRRSDEFNNITALYIEALEVEEVIAQLLAVEGFSSVEQIAESELQILKSIEGFDEELALEIQTRAINYVNNKNEKIITILEELGVQQELIDIIDVTPEQLVILAQNGIKDLHSLAANTSQRIRKLIPNIELTDKELNSLIEDAKQEIIKNN